MRMSSGSFERRPDGSTAGLARLLAGCSPWKGVEAVASHLLQVWAETFALSSCALFWNDPVTRQVHWLSTNVPDVTQPAAEILPDEVALSPVQHWVETHIAAEEPVFPSGPPGLEHL